MGETSFVPYQQSSDGHFDNLTGDIQQKREQQLADCKLMMAGIEKEEQTK
jgi:hypothetical protein